MEKCFQTGHNLFSSTSLPIDIGFGVIKPSRKFLTKDKLFIIFCDPTKKFFVNLAAFRQTNGQLKGIFKEIQQILLHMVMTNEL